MQSRFKSNIPSIKHTIESMVYCSQLPNLVRLVGYEELAEELEPIRDGEIFWNEQ